MNILSRDEMKIFYVGNIKPSTRIKKILMNKHGFLEASSFSLILLFPISFKIFLILFLEIAFRCSWDGNGRVANGPWHVLPWCQNILKAFYSLNVSSPNYLFLTLPGSDVA